MNTDPIKELPPSAPIKKLDYKHSNGLGNRVKNAVIQVFKTLGELILLPITVMKGRRVSQKGEKLIEAVLRVDPKGTKEFELEGVRFLLKGLSEREANVVDKRGFTAMDCAISMGRLDLIELLGEKCNPNIGGKKPPLKSAIASGNLEVVEALLNLKKIDPNLKKEKIKPLELALTGMVKDEKPTESKSQAIVKSLLAHPKVDLRGVNLKQYNLQGPEFKNIRDLLEIRVSEFKLKEKLPKAAHILDLSGEVRLKGVRRVNSVCRRAFALEDLNLRYGKARELDSSRVKKEVTVQLEGAPTARTFYSKISKGLKKYGGTNQNLLSDKESRTLGAISQAYGFSALPHKASELLERVNKGELTVIETGFKGHSVTVLFWKDYFVLCNRGDASRRPIEVYRYKKDALTEEMVQKIMDARNHPAKNYKKLFHHELPEKLSFERDQKVEQRVFLPEQVVGNCTWKSSETGVYAALILNNQNLQLYWNWLNFQQVKKIKSLLKLPSQTSYKLKARLYRQAFCNARVVASKSDDAKVREELNQLKNDYLERLSRRQRLRFKVAWVASGTRVPFVRKIFT